MAAEYEVAEVSDAIDTSRGRRLAELEAENAADEDGADGRGRFVIHPDNRWYQLWTHVILIWAVYSSFFTPMEFGFFRGLPRNGNLHLLDIAGQIAFFIDIFVQFHLSYRDPQTYRIITSPSRIALRYLKGNFVIDLLGCMPWDVIYVASGRKEEVRYLLWIRLSRAQKVTSFFEKLEKDIRVNYLFTRIVKLIVVELYCTHTAACIFYYLATTLPPSMERYTWIGSLQLGDYHYENFREIDLWKRYVTSMYFAVITMATVGYGDIHAVNVREMVFIMIFVSLDMILGAYLIGNMTALTVKGSKTERFRDKMADLIRYMNRNRLGKDIRAQIKGHVRLQYESGYTDSAVLQDIPVAIRAKISETLYKPCIERTPLFTGCSPEFIYQIAIRLHEEFYLPGEVIMEQGSAVDQLYFVCHGALITLMQIALTILQYLEGVGISDDESEETILNLKSDSSFGELAIVCNIPQPYTIRVTQLCRLLRIDKQSFSNILQIYSSDWRIILTNITEANKLNVGKKELELDIMFHIRKQEAELALKVNSSAYHGDLRHLKGLIHGGADPNMTDYNGRSPLHLAASRGYEDIVLYLIHKGADINKADKFGNTPLLEAIKNGHEHVASLFIREGALVSIDDAGCHLCMAVARGDVDYVKRVLSYGIDPDVRDYDHKTPLHIAASEGMFMMAKILLESGADVSSKDRWGRTPLDEARKIGSDPLIKLLEAAKPSGSSTLKKMQETEDGQRRKCTVFAFHPWDPEDKRSEGVVLWVPPTIEELIRLSEQHLQLQCSPSRILSEDGGRILDTYLISDGQKLYLAS